MTLVWNNMHEVIGPRGGISYPAQLIPMMIGALSFVRITVLLIQQWRFPPEEDCCEENEQQERKPSVSSGGGGVGLGLGPSAYSPATNAVIAGHDYDTSVVSRSSIAKRYLVAYLPWLSQFDFWKQHQHSDHRQGCCCRGCQPGGEENGTNYRDSPSPTTRTGYESGSGVNPHISMMSAATTITPMSPMIDMKSPTSVAFPDSPLMGRKI